MFRPSLILVALTASLVSATPLIFARAGDGLNATQQSEFVTLHNQIRAQHGAVALTWNSTLANAGASWANKCVFEHSGGSLGPYGENLAAGTGSGYDVPQAMSSWTNEESSYNPSNPQPSHYTQIVWKGTKQFGCGLASCAASTIFPAEYGPAKFFACEYFPAGNVIGEFPQNVQ